VELHFWDIAEGKVLCTFSDGMEDLGWWLMEWWVSGGFLWWAFIWMQTLAGSSRWHHQGCLRPLNMVGTKCLDHLAKGYLILNTRKYAKVGKRTLDDNDYEGVNNPVDNSKCT
jgi:hypothetical protein